MDKLKGTAMQAVNPAGMAGQRDKIMRLNKVGVLRPAVVNSMQETGTQPGGGRQIEFDLTVQPQERERYQVHVSQSLHDATLQGVAVGARINVNVDPEDPQSVLVWERPPDRRS